LNEKPCFELEGITTVGSMEQIDPDPLLEKVTMPVESVTQLIWTVNQGLTQN
jgi:hypothetical protein